MSSTLFARAHVLERSRHDLLMSHPELTVEERELATRAVASAAQDVDDARTLLLALGLLTNAETSGAGR